MDDQPARRGTKAVKCSTCLGLQYELYQPLSSWIMELRHFFPISKRDLLSRQHRASFASIKEAAEKGCSFCSILSQGCDLFWPLEADRSYVPAKLYNTGSEKRKELVMQRTGLSAKQFQENFMWDLAIEIRPGRGLLLSRMGKPCMTKVTGEILHDTSCLWFCALRPSRAPVEFFTTKG